MYCNKCGRRYHFLHVYCSFCGTKLNKPCTEYHKKHDSFKIKLKQAKDDEIKTMWDESYSQIKKNKKDIVAHMNAYDELGEMINELRIRELKILTEPEEAPEREFMTKEETVDYIESNTFLKILRKADYNIAEMTSVNNSDFQNKLYNETKMLLELAQIKYKE